MKGRACAVFVLLLLALFSVGSQAQCSPRDSKCLLDFSGCSRPCKSRCRVYYPASAFWSWREGEWTGCYQTCIDDCLKQKRECEVARGARSD
jgi:hypothetical protein